MSVSITLPKDLESFLERQALRLGISMETLLARTIIDHWDNIRRAPTVSPEEADLLLRLQSLFPTEQTQEYKTLCERSDAETITVSERQRLLNLIEQRDHQNAERLTIVAEIANLRGISFREAMRQLGIRPE